MAKNSTSMKLNNTPVKYFATLPVIFLTSFNRGASFFIHGLIDSHHQVSTIPFIFPLLNLINDNTSSKDMRDPTLISAIQRFMQEKLDNENFNFNLELFSNYYLEFLSKQEFANKEKSIFYAVHYAWSMLNKQEIYRLKVIFWHPHNHNADYENFIVNTLKSKLLFTSKDPREALVSAYQYWKSSKGIFLLPPTETSYLYEELIVNYISSSLNRYAFYLNNKDTSLVIKTEEMNNEPERIISEMANFINIDVNENIFSSTFLGHQKGGESSRGLRGFDNKINSERWHEELSDFIITFLELINYDYLREFGYSPKIVVTREELFKLRGNVFRALTKIPCSMRTKMLENARNEAELATGKHFHPKLKKLEIFLRLLRKYLLLYFWCTNIYKHFRKTYKNQLSLNLNH